MAEKVIPFARYIQFAQAKGWRVSYGTMWRDGISESAVRFESPLSRPIVIIGVEQSDPIDQEYATYLDRRLGIHSDLFDED